MTKRRRRKEEKKKKKKKKKKEEGHREGKGRIKNRRIAQKKVDEYILPRY